MKRIISTSLSLMLVGLLIFSAPAVPVKAVSPAQSGGANIKVTQVDTSAFPRVKVYVSITDQNGEPMAVDPAGLVLKENGIEMTPEQVSGKGETGALITILAIDVSGSMFNSEKLKTAKEVAKSYVEQMRSGDQAGILAFNVTNQMVQPVTADKAALANAIDSLQADGDTAFYDALATAVDVVNPLSGRKAVIALTDGMDNHSKLSIPAVIEAIGEKGLTISTVGFGEPGQAVATLAGLDEYGLKRIADETGGYYSYANNKAALQKVYQQYGRALQSEYEITYISPSYLRDGLNRSLEVSFASGTLAGTSGSMETKYNPGGLVPEMASTATWPLFFGLFFGLLVLLAVPFAFEYVQGLRPKKSRIKLSPPPTGHRIKLK
ncbi:MAG: VWA domain-containing protein [Anaerolineaceae bacterium]